MYEREWWRAPWAEGVDKTPRKGTKLYEDVITSTIAALSDDPDLQLPCRALAQRGAGLLQPRAFWDGWLNRHLGLGGPVYVLDGQKRMLTYRFGPGGHPDFAGVAQALGCRFSLYTTHEGREVPWDGRVMHGFSWRRDDRAVPFSPEDLWHELGHWLCAPDEESRSYIGFGEGESYDIHGSMESDGPRCSDNTEPQASAVGILLHWTFDPVLAKEHAESHGWHKRDGNAFRQIVHVMRKNEAHTGFRRAMTRLYRAGFSQLGHGDDVISTFECSDLRM